MTDIDPVALAAGVQRRDRASIGRAITLVESTRDEDRVAARALMNELTRPAPAHPTLRLGITGVPGVGKSTFVECLGRRLTGQGHKVSLSGGCFRTP